MSNDHITRVTNAKGEILHVTSQQAASFLARAAEILKANPYTPRPEYEGEKGLSAGLAVCLATGCKMQPTDHHFDHSVACDETRRRLIGYLYMSGDLVTTPHASGMAQELDWYEQTPAYVARERLVAALMAAAAILAAHLDDYARLEPHAPRAT